MLGTFETRILTIPTRAICRLQIGVRPVGICQSHPSNSHSQLNNLLLDWTDIYIVSVSASVLMEKCQTELKRS